MARLGYTGERVFQDKVGSTYLIDVAPELASLNEVASIGGHDMYSGVASLDVCWM